MAVTMRVSTVLPLLCALFLLPPAHSEDPQRGTEPPRPHIIYILADDMGFHDAPWHNSLVRAPALQGLVAGGVTLEQSYMLPVGSPSRAALLSGKYPHTSGMLYKSIKPLQPTGLPLNLTLLPETLKGLGYTTHAIGKWHLGFCKDEYTPLRRGFDTFRGFYTGSLDYYSHSSRVKLESSNSPDEDDSEKKSADNVSGSDFRNNDSPDDLPHGEYSTSEFVRNAQTLLRTRDPQVPMFLYLALQNPHGPLQVPRRYLDMYPEETNPKRKVFMGMLSALDDAVQSVLDTLKETGHYDNSIIVFSSDNGGSARKMGLNWPLRGTKGSLFEGGTRVPALITSPLIPQHGTAYQGIFHATDWYPTLVSAAGGTPPTDLDGIDQWGALKGVQPPPRKQMVYQMISKQGFQTAMRYENYKVFLGNFKDRGWFVPPEFQNIDKELLTNFLDSGRAMNIAPSRPDLDQQSDNSSISDGLIYSDSNDMVTVENPGSDYYYYDDDNQENPEQDALVELTLTGTISELSVSGSRVSTRRADSIDNQHEGLAEGLSAQLEQDLASGEGQHREQRQRNRNRTREEQAAFRLKRKQEREKKKEERAQAKEERKRLRAAQREAERIASQAEKKTKVDQRRAGNQGRNIGSFNSVESILASGIPILLYDLKKDPYERHNIAAQEPELIESLLHLLLQEMKSYVPPSDPPLSLKGSPSYFGGFWSPGWC